MIRAFLCVMDDDLLQDLIHLNHENDIEIVGFSAAIPADLDFLLDLQVDAVVVRDAIDAKRADAMTEKIRNDPIYRHLHMIHLFREIDGCTFHTLIQSCVNNYLLGTYTAKDVLRKIQDEMETADPTGDLVKFIEEIGSQILIESGIQENLKGFSYMKTAAFAIAQHSSRISMNEVYRYVATVHDSTPDSVEKAIRSAIHQGYKSHPDRMIFHVKKPTNSWVLRMLIEVLKIRGMMG